MSRAALALLTVSLTGLLWPLAIALPLALLAAWAGAALLMRARVLRGGAQQGARDDRDKPAG